MIGVTREEADVDDEEEEEDDMGDGVADVDEMDEETEVNEEDLEGVAVFDDVFLLFTIELLRFGEGVFMEEALVFFIGLTVEVLLSMLSLLLLLLPVTFGDEGGLSKSNFLGGY